MEAGYIIGQMLGFAVVAGLAALLFVRGAKLSKITGRNAWQTIRMVLYFILGGLLVLGVLSMFG